MLCGVFGCERECSVCVRVRVRLKEHVVANSALCVVPLNGRDGGDGQLHTEGRRRCSATH